MLTSQHQNLTYFPMFLQTLPVNTRLMLLLKEVGALLMPLLPLMLEVEALLRTLLALMREVVAEG